MGYLLAREEPRPCPCPYSTEHPFRCQGGSGAMPNRRAFLAAGTSSGSIAGPIPGGMLLMTPAPPTATWNGRHWRAAANTGVVRIRAVGGDYKRPADFRPAGVLPKQTDAIGGAGVWSPRSRKRSLSSPVAVRKNVTDVTRHAVCALRSGPPPRGTQYCQSASDTSPEVAKSKSVARSGPRAVQRRVDSSGCETRPVTGRSNR
jgi:hypothetical protein